MPVLLLWAVPAALSAAQAIIWFAPYTTLIYREGEARAGETGRVFFIASATVARQIGRAHV